MVQSNYIPWKGYFDMIRRVDEFVLFDDVQFTRRDWRNRNLIKTAAGLHWLTIPVASKSRFDQLICETQIEDPSWADRHWRTLESNYRRARGWPQVAARLRQLYDAAAGERSLSVVNHTFIQGICGMLGIGTRLGWSMDYPREGHKTDRLLAICRAAGATTYLSGPAARSYLEEAKFEAAGIAVEWMEYGPYRVYDQRHGDFEHKVSVIDLLANLGDDAAGYLDGPGRLAPFTAPPRAESAPGPARMAAS